MIFGCYLAYAMAHASVCDTMLSVLWMYGWTNKGSFGVMAGPDHSYKLGLLGTYLEFRFISEQNCRKYLEV